MNWNERKYCFPNTRSVLEYTPCDQVQESLRVCAPVPVAYFKTYGLQQDTTDAKTRHTNQSPNRSRTRNKHTHPTQSIPNDASSLPPTTRPTTKPINTNKLGVVIVHCYHRHRQKT